MNLRPLRPDQQQNATRWSYHRPSEDFIGWVNKLGIEKTWAGRIAASLDRRFQVKTLLLLSVFTLILSFFINWDLQVPLSEYKEGGIYTQDLKSPYSFDVVDREETNRRIGEAENATLPVYDLDVGLYSEKALAFRTAFKNLKDLSLKQNEFEQNLEGTHISREAFQWLLSQRNNGGVDSIIAENLEKWGDFKIADDSVSLRQSPRSRVIVNVLENGYTGDEFVQDTTSILDTDEVRSRLSHTQLPLFLSKADGVQIKEILKSLIVPNLTLNRQETELRRSRAKLAVAPYLTQIKKNQIIVRSGVPVQKTQMETIDALKIIQRTRHQDFVSLITALLLLILLLSFKGYISRFISKVKISAKDAAAMGTILLVEVIFLKLLMHISEVALFEKFGSVPQSFYLYLFPASFGAMMVGLIIPFGEIVWLFSIFLSVVLGLISDRSFGYMLVVFTSSIVAARGVYGCKKREDLYWAGLKTGLVNMSLVFCLTLITSPVAGGGVRALLWNLGAGFLSGFFACFVALTLIPLMETLFIYTTDVKLLELSNLNHPLLKDLIVKAPGTYHHCLVVGSMCEAAAEAIGANPLLAKVSAYYHDIGKTDYAQYFIENQKPGENLHDHINPGMSKTILIAHVKDGVEKGLKYKLGKEIIEVIEQHHGTTLISFFYHRAKETEDTTMHETTEEEYKYPGPKPTSREAALCMLGDSVEAAARSLDEPTPARLQTIVHNIVQRKFLDGQLDNCDLTLRDLNVIEEAFSRILLGIYHQRIDYPVEVKTKKTTKPTAL